MDPADVWCFSHFPFFNDPVAFGVSRVIELFEAGAIEEAEHVAAKLPMIDLNGGEAC